MTIDNQRPAAGYALARLIDLLTRLRAPDGCLWDQKQDAANVSVYLLEEAYKVLEAVVEGNPAQVASELGDLAFQVVFLSRALYRGRAVRP